MNFSVDVDGERATIRVHGYLSQNAGETLSYLVRGLRRSGVKQIGLDISRCSPLCVAALERLLEAKVELSGIGIDLAFERSNPTLAKVFRLMGLRANGEPTATESVG